MKRRLTLLSAAILLAPAGAHPPPTFHPTRLGIEWVYVRSDTKQESTYFISKVLDNNGWPHIVISENVAGRVVTRDGLIVRPDGLWTPQTGNPDPPRLCEMLLPHVDGQSWFHDDAAKDLPAEKRTVATAKMERIKVAAGEFDCVRVDVAHPRPGQPAEVSSAWYAKGVGKVKLSWVDRGDVRTMELKSFRMPH